MFICRPLLLRLCHGHGLKYDFILNYFFCQIPPLQSAPYRKGTKCFSHQICFFPHLPTYRVVTCLSRVLFPFAPCFPIPILLSKVFNLSQKVHYRLDLVKQSACVNWDLPITEFSSLILIRISLHTSDLFKWIFFIFCPAGIEWEQVRFNFLNWLNLLF